MFNPTAGYSTVMIVDNCPSNSRLLRYVLVSLKFTEEVLTFESPFNALDFLANSDDSKIPDILFIDLNGSVMNDSAFLDALNKLPNEVSKKTKIILTKPLDWNYVRSEIDENRIEYISKPLQGYDLSRVLTKKSN